MRIEKVFSPADLEAVEAAVAAAEARTSGEIVPYAVSHSDHYEAAVWKGATLGAFAGVVAAAAGRWLADTWGGPGVPWIVAPPLVGGAVGWIAAALLRPLRLALAGRAVVDHRVQARAAAAFLEGQVFATRERTGVLVFLSLYERRVVVMGDKGIAARVGQHEWDGIVAGIVAGMRAGRPGHALAEAIGRCGELLARDGVARRADDADELPDQLRLREE